MKRNTIVISSILILIFFGACSKDYLKTSVIDNYSITSDYTGEKYNIQVLLPENYDSNTSYSTAYLIDGYYHFNDLGNEKIRLVESGDMQDIIIVSIEYDGVGIASISDLKKIEELREIDLTYPKNLDQGKETGGGALLFYDFLKLELIPLIEANYTTSADSRTLLGHSLGGYFCIFQSFNFASEPLFENVVSASPSIWWADYELIRMEQNLYDNSMSLPVNLYLSMGNLEGVGMNAAYDEFVEKLDEHNIEMLNFTSEKNKKGHFPNAIVSFSNALKSIF
jgi:predicted alpha/beta superfamily hydrolase